MTDTTTGAEEGVVFHSEASNYYIVRDPERRRQVGETNDFEVVGGRKYQFYDGILRVTDSDDIEWLRNYESNGRYYWELGTPEDRTSDSSDLQAVIVTKALDGDFGGIADILVAERTALSRPEVISACEAALNAGDKELPPSPATPLHEQQRVRMGPTAGITPGVSPDPVPGSPQVDPSTLTETPGLSAAPQEAPAVPVGQYPAEGETPEGTSTTMPSAQGPLAGTSPAPLDAPATTVPQGEPVSEEPPAPAREEDEPTPEGDAASPGEPVSEDQA